MILARKRVFLFIMGLFTLFIAFKVFIMPSQSYDFKDTYTQCLKLQQRNDTGECLRNLANNALDKSSISEIEVSLKPTIGTANSEWCHEFMHYLGWSTALRHTNLAEAFTNASSICASGMYHGVVEQYLSTMQTEKTLEEKALLVSNDCKNSSEIIQTNCYHGMGHAFMFVTDNDLKQSTHLCEKLPSNQLSNCFTGVFMEVTQPKQVASVHKTYSFENIDPNYPCEDLLDENKSDCYLYKGNLNFYLANQNSKSAFENCSLVENYEKECYLGVGHSLLRPNWSVETLAKDCNYASTVNKIAHEQCIKGVVPFIMETTQGNPAPAFEFCTLLKFNNQICSDEVQSYLEMRKLSQ